MNRNETSDATCNGCGDSCILTHEPFTEFGGLRADVCGGYFSTAGNGYGALDDMHRYRFKLCEFCLDALFARFVVKPDVSLYQFSGRDEEKSEFTPALKRIERDSWREDSYSRSEILRRNELRKF